MLYRRTYGIGRGGGLGYGRGRGGGMGYGRGMGFGFRGTSPPWPYIGLGRGGLPRCGYFLGNTWAEASPFAYEAPFAWQMTQAKEVDFLKNEAALLESQLEQAQARIRTLETNKDS